MSENSFEEWKNLASKIERDGGKASAIRTDATNEKQVVKLFDEVGEGLKLAIYNPGNNTPGKIIDMKADYFSNSWKICCYGRNLNSLPPY